MVKWACYVTHTSSQKVRRTGHNWIGLETRSQVTNHCNGHASHLKTAPSLSLSFCPSVSLPLAVFCHNPAYVTASRRTWSFHLKEPSEWKDLTVRSRLFHRKAPEKAILTCFIYKCLSLAWPRQTKLTVPKVGIASGRVCVYRLDIYIYYTLWASLLRTMYMNKPLLYSSCLCRLITL